MILERQVINPIPCEQIDLPLQEFPKSTSFTAGDYLLTLARVYVEQPKTSPREFIDNPKRFDRMLLMDVNVRYNPENLEHLQDRVRLAHNNHFMKVGGNRDFLYAWDFCSRQCVDFFATLPDRFLTVPMPQIYGCAGQFVSPSDYVKVKGNPDYSVVSNLAYAVKLFSTPFLLKLGGLPRKEYQRIQPAIHLEVSVF
ncbi:MAG: hypothetical protein AABX04_05690 [Nanoarchaeota archaeon]